jgi:hypothetical protein
VAAVSTNVRDLPFSEPLLALGLGVVVGPEVLGLIHVPEEERPRLERGCPCPARGLFDGRGSALPRKAAAGRTQPHSLVGDGGHGRHGLMWLVLGVPIALAVLLGACLTPTDPVLASSVVTGRPAEGRADGRGSEGQP